VLPKSVTFWIDASAEKDLRINRVSLEKILARVMQIYREENHLPFVGYNLKNLKRRAWKRGKIKERYVRSDHDLWQYYVRASLMKEIERGCKLKKIQTSSNVNFFLSGELILGNGLTRMPRHPRGNGVVLIGTRNGGVSKNPFARLSYNLRLALVMIHEQTHLFGLRHVDDSGSIMYEETNSNRQFDEDSRLKLFAAMRRWSKKIDKADVVA